MLSHSEDLTRARLLKEEFFKFNNSIKALKRATFCMPNFHNFRARILQCHSNL